MTDQPNRRRTPSEAARDLAVDLPGGRAAADELVRAYLAEATARHGLPDDGWWLDLDDLAEIRARHTMVNHERGQALAPAHEAADCGAAGVEAQADDHGDREWVLDEGAPAAIGGMCFTPDEAAPGGTRPLTETELREVTDRVRATQAEAIAQGLDPPPAEHRPGFVQDATDESGWQR